MNVWKVILAALVIFAAGVITGGLTVRLKIQEVPERRTAPPGPRRGDLLDRMQRQLYLTPLQRERIEVVLRESHERMKTLWDSIAPQAQEEQRRVHELIKAELTPEQQQTFETMMKARGPRFPDEKRRFEERREPRSSRREPISRSKPESKPESRDGEK